MTSAAKVGVVMLFALAVLGYFVLRIEDLEFGRSKTTHEVKVVFDDVAGLQEESTVRIAGVQKGHVKDIIATPEGKALVTLVLEDDVPLHANATARVANLGLLGEKYIELEPGDTRRPMVTSQSMLPVQPPTVDGKRVAGLTLPGSQPATIDDVTSQISSIATDVKAVTASMRAALGGEQGQARLEEIVENVRDITARVRTVIEINEGNINATAANFRKITDDLRVEIPRIASSIERFANSVSGTVGENREDVRVIVENLRGLSADLRVTADNLNDITGQVKTGEGTVGKLIYSDEAHDRLTGALASVETGVTELKNTLGRVGKIEMDLGIKADYYAGLDEQDGDDGFDGSSRSVVSVNVVPNPERNRFYNIELADDPRGKKKDKIVQTTTIDEAGNEVTLTTRQTKYERDFLISAQAGWEADDLRLRVGLFDNSGGVGADYAVNERLSATLEAFDFGQKRDDNPHLRFYSNYVIRKEKANSPLFFISTGVDNPLNDTAFTLGGGIRWRDEDLKYLLGSVPLGR